MQTLVVYDSVYGNTELVGQSIGAAIPGEARVRPVGQVSAADLGNVDLLIIGSPTHGALPTEAIQGFLKRLGSPPHDAPRWPPSTPV